MCLKGRQGDAAGGVPAGTPLSPASGTGQLALSLGPSLTCQLGQTSAPSVLAEPEKLAAATRVPVALGTGSLVARGLCLNKPAEAKSKQTLSAAKCSPVGQHVPCCCGRDDGGARLRGRDCAGSSVPKSNVTWPASPCTAGLG